MSYFTSVPDDDGVVAKDEREDEEMNVEVEEIEAPLWPPTLCSDSDPSKENQVDEEEQPPDDVFHVEDKVSIVPLTPTKEYEDQIHLQKEAEMVKFMKEKVDTKENGLMHTSLLDWNDDLEIVVNETKSVETM